MIRPAQPGDAATVRRIVREAYAHYVERIGKEPGPMIDDYDARIAAGEVSILETDGIPTGIIVLENHPDRFQLDNIAVARGQQGRGLGRTLIAFAERSARDAGHREIRLYTHVMMTENIALYTRLGFRETGRVQEKGFDRVYMAKTLDDRPDSAA